MKCTIYMMRSRLKTAPIERFAFDFPYANKLNFMSLLSTHATNGFDPLIEEQDIALDLEQNSYKPDYMVVASETADADLIYQNYYPAYWFFYVTKITRKPGRATSLVHVKLDAVTTLSVECLRNSTTLEAILTSQSYVTREHKMRFYKPSNYDPSDAPYLLQYVIDPVPEGIPVELTKIRQKTLYNNTPDIPAVKWYLVYKSADVWSTDTASSNPITAYLVPSTPLKVSAATSSGTGSSVVWTDPSDASFVTYNYHIITKTNSPGFSMKISGTGRINGSGTITSFTDVVFSSASYCMVQIYYEYSGSTMYARIRAYKGSVDAITGMDEYDCTTNVLGGKITKFEFTTATFFYVLQTGSTSSEDIEQGTQIQINAGTTSVSAVYSTYFNALNRSDPLLVKVIELPYCPGNISYDSGDSTISIYGWDFDDASSMFVPNSNAPYNQYLYDNVNSSTSVSLETYKKLYNVAPSVTAAWDGEDPKLWHSDFHPVKVVYDVYAVDIKLEKTGVTPSLYTSATGRSIYAVWHVSPDINSIFALNVKMLYNTETDAPDQDFGEWVVIDRNNEKPIFTNAYLNYMRVGYNYDQKAKSIQNWASILGVAASAVGTIAGAATGQAAFTAMSAASLVSSITSLATGIAGRENSMQAKLADLKAQATSVSGSNDVAILDKYCPWVQFIEYEPVDYMKSSLARMFHLYGYKTGRFKVPDISSRSLWNYIECEPVFSGSANFLNQLPGNLFTRAAEQMRAGITILHYNASVTGYFDYQQSCENWENELL